MKTYKEINDELHVRDEIKKNTIHQMMKPKVKHKKSYIVVGVTCLLLVVCGVLFQHTSSSNQTKQKKDIAFKIDEYIQPQKNMNENKTGSGELYKASLTDTYCGEMKDINLESYGFKGVVNASAVVVPKGFEYCTAIFEEEIEEGKKLPYIQYHFQKDTLFFNVKIQHNNMRIYEEDHRKKYNGYELYIQKYSLNEGSMQYHAIATKGKLRYTMNTIVDKEEEFQDFLLSVLK